jgi:Lrp/AsnC family transcriptional regulator, leucine-responsive regulatory protein
MKKIDRKLLFELDLNSRQSYGQIATKLNTSKQVIGNHIHKLTNEGYIKKFLVTLDLSKFGFIMSKIYIRLMRASLEDEEEIIAYMNNHKNVAWLVRTEGAYDFAFVLHTRDIFELDTILQNFEGKYGKFILERVVNRSVSGAHFPRSYLIENGLTNMEKTVFTDVGTKTLRIDEIDEVILAGLSKDARTSSTKIASKLSISADAVGKRIKKLERSGIIKGYTIVPSNSKMNQIVYKLLINTINFNSKTEAKLKEFCRQNSNIIFYTKVIGAWDLELDLEVESSLQFRNIMRIFKKQFADLIRDYHLLIIYDISKHNPMPMYSF